MNGWADGRIDWRDELVGGWKGCNYHCESASVL